eukprot:COSAG02_NODE_17506_length_999_cov_0.733333_2_plen_103_part_01
MRGSLRVVGPEQIGGPPRVGVQRVAPRVAVRDALHHDAVRAVEEHDELRLAERALHPARLLRIAREAIEQHHALGVLADGAAAGALQQRVHHRVGHGLPSGHR